MWNLKYGKNDPVYKTETGHSHGEQTCGCRGDGGGSGMDGEFGIGGCKWLDLEWMGIGGPTVWHRELCMTGSPCCTTEIEETL